MRAFPFLAVLLASAPAAAETPQFGLPLACTVGEDCWVQQYVDHDPTAGVRDYNCGSQTYDGHDGTDIRILDTSAHAAVLAAADGLVKATRDGVPDRLARTEEERATVAEIECGNGVLLDHGGGWETQYCHLRKGSIGVRKGMRIKADERLGDVGYSGMAAFPHVHFTIRKDGKPVDPFRNASDSSCGGMQEPLWTGKAAETLVYQRGTILAGGFAPGPVELSDLESGNGPIDGVVPAAGWLAAVVYVWLVNLEAGDEVTVTFSGPARLAADASVKLDRPKAQYLLFAGKKRPPDGWPRGHYTARADVTNGGVLRLRRSWEATLD